MSEKAKELERMNDLNNWSEPARGLFRYVLGANFCYEILILTHCEGTHILTAKATAYASGEWDDNGTGVYERETLLEGRPVMDCLDAARKDYEENCGG